MSRTFIGAVALALWFPASLLAQATGTIVGTVTDESKAVLPGVTVTAAELTTGRQYVGVTDARGEYRLLNVAAGTFKVQAELAGFGTVTIASIQLLVGQNATIPFAMKVAGLQESVTVTSEAPLVDISSSEVAGNVDRRQMEELPLQGRNWMELSMLVKGITANDVNSNNQPGEARDEHFQLNLDGQQITQRVASSFFGQPRLSREAVAEFQIVTNLFDITQGRSSGIQVQAISRSGSNQLNGSFYGYFRDDKFNAADFIAKRVLPYQDQQVGSTIGGPIRKDKLLYFLSYEYERNPQPYILTPPLLPNQQFVYEGKAIQHSLTGRADQVLSSKDNLSFRGTFWNFNTPFDAANTDHPSNARARKQESDSYLATWSRVMNANTVGELKIGYNHFNWQNLLAFPDVGGCTQNFGEQANQQSCRPNYVFPGGLTVGPPRNFPQNFIQNLVSARYDLNWHRNTHDLKLGGEFLGWKDTGEWHLLERGEFIITSVPTDLERRFPQAAPLDRSQWDVSGLDGITNRYAQNVGDWTIDIPRPSWAVWFGDTWRANNKLTLNYGLRWDVDWGATAPPHVTTQIRFEPWNGPLFRSDIRDLNNVAPRVGFAYNVTGDNTFVIRGGSGLYYTVSSSNVTFSQQSFNTQRILVNSYPNDSLPGFIVDPTRGVTPADVLSGKVPLPPQSPRVIDHDYVGQYTWQNSIGFQKQLNPTLGFEADLTYYKEYNYPRGRDPNLNFDPVTGYTGAQFGRPDPKFTSIQLIENTGHADNMALSSGLTRRFKDNFQAAVTYTLMFYRNDDSTGWGHNANNHADQNGEWARSNDFQRSTLRLNGIYKLPLGFTVAGSYFYGSGNYFATTVAGDPYVKGSSQNRLRLGSTVTIPDAFRDQYEGPAVINDGDVIPRNALRGTALHKVDLRVTKDFKLPGGVNLSGIAEVFNLLNHENFGAFNGVVTSATFGTPQQVAGSTAYTPRAGQFAFRLSF